MTENKPYTAERIIKFEKEIKARRRKPNRAPMQAFVQAETEPIPEKKLGPEILQTEFDFDTYATVKVKKDKKK